MSIFKQQVLKIYDFCDAQQQQMCKYVLCILIDFNLW